MGVFLIDEVPWDRSISDRPGMQGTHRCRRLEIRNLLVLPLIFAVIFALLRATGHYRPASLISGSIGGAALWLAFLRAHSRSRVIGVFAGVGVGTLVSLMGDFDSCSPRSEYILLAPILGWLGMVIFTGLTDAIASGREPGDLNPACEIPDDPDREPCVDSTG